ncbi:MAG: class I SAM-dependent methyltransferase [Candidatus Cloacimonetes bacterium]|nr:class I SAM-dependent methyltransferase [Candidatus Cloacimonadota bacterium]
MKDVFKKLSHIDAGKVLDAATGRGDFINVVKSSFKSYTQIIGVDNADAAVKQAQKLFPENNIEIYKMDLENLSFTDNYFDTVCLSNSLHHIERKDIVFRELLRVLKKNGLLLVVEMYKDGKQTQAQQTHIMMHHWFARIDMLNKVYHWQTLDRDELLEIAQSLDLNNLAYDDFYIPVDNPSDPKVIEPMIKNVQDWIKKCETIPEAEFICCEGQKIIERIKTTGCVSASKLLITGYKK